MATAPLANLSLLSRGVGEVQQDGHEKIEVKLEPEDYNNWLEDSRRIWNIPAVLPPIQSTLPPTFHHTAGADRLTESLPSHRSRPVPTARDVEYSKVYLPKTFTTRKGALLLFSEDFANKKLSGSTEQVVVKEKPAPLPELRTVDDLAKSILAYGATKSFSYSGEHEANSDDIYLGFVNTRSKKYYERQYKPGFSAKRYLSSWSKLWDYSLLTKITNKGYIKPLPFQKKSDYDVSGIPLPYRILRQWLFAPGTIDGYTFYRQSKYQQVPTREPTIVIVEETPRPVSVESEISTGSIKVSSLIANKDLNYGELDSTTKESILTELLVKSAITHAIKKQKEYQETVSKNLDDEEAKRKASAKLYEFDMMNAIQSALENSAMPTVTFSTIESQGVIPQEYPKKKPRQGFRGVKGIGLRVSPTSSSVDSSFSIRSLEDKRRVLPPIIREDGKTSGHPLIGDEFPTIPTAVHSHLNQLHKPLSIADADEEYTSWRKSVLSSRNNVAVVGEDSSKPSKSMSKVTMDNVGDDLKSLATDTPAAALTALATDGGSISSSLLDLTNSNNHVPASHNNSNNQPSLVSADVLPAADKLPAADTLSAADASVEQNVQTITAIEIASPDFQSDQRYPATSKNDTLPQTTMEALPTALEVVLPAVSAATSPATVLHTGGHFNRALESLGSPTSTVTYVSKAKIKKTKQPPSSSLSNAPPPAPKILDSVADYGEGDQDWKTSSVPLEKPDAMGYKETANIDITSTVPNLLQDSIIDDDDVAAQSVASEGHQGVLLAVPDVPSRNPSAESKTPASLYSSAIVLDASFTRSTEDISPAKPTLKSVDLFTQVGLDADDDKKSVISTMSMLSLTSKRSRYSGSGIDAPYTKGITARQDPSGSLLKVDMTGDENDPTAAITSWRYNVQQVEPYADRVKIEEVVEPPESLVEPTPSPLPPDVESSASEMEPSLAEEPAAEVEAEEEIEAAVEEVPAPPTPPISVPSPEEHRTPTSLPPPTPVESPAEITEDQFMEVLTEQAREIAKAVLEQNPDAGNDLAFDAKTAAEMLMSNLPDGHTATGSSSRTQSKTGHTVDVELEDGSATEDAVDGGGFTVGQLVKEGLEDLVVKLDEYVQQDEPSTAAPSTVYSPSVPSMHSQTPSVRSSRHSSAQQGISSGVSSAHQGISSRISSAQQEMSLAQSAAESRAASIPSAHHLTPSIAPSPTTVASLNQASPSKSGVSSARTQLKSASTINRELESAKAAAAANSISAEAERVQSELSKKSSTTPSKKSAGKVQHESEFVVGKVADKAELQQLYAPIDSDSSPGKAKAKPGKSKSIVPKPAPKKEAPKKVEKPPVKKIVKKGGKKKAKASTASAAVESHTETETSAIQSPVVVPPKEPTPIPEPEPEPEEWKTPEPEEEPDMEFVIVRDEFSDEEEKSETEDKPQLGSVKSLNYGSASPGPSVTGSSTLDEEFDYTSEEEEAIPGLSNRDAQAAKRAAAKEKRRKEVERRRREREEALRKEKEDAERKERIRIQMEEERARREEEIRLKKEMEKEERERLEREEEAKLKAQRDAQERERRRQEEMAKYLEEKRQRALEEERRRKELQAEKDAEEAERLRLEQEMLQAMAEEERAEFLRRKAEEERLQKIAEEEARIKREAEAKRAWEALQLQEAERKKAEEILRQRLLFQRSLNVEANGMDHSQDISRAFVFSYYELLKWLGYEIPDWAQFGPTPATNYNVVDPDFTNQPINQPKH